jgi:predicted nuclease with TOPRIM domain
MADELYDVLTRFHREVVIPDMQRMIGEVRSEVLSHFDTLYKRLDRLESEYQALRAAVIRIEEKLDRTALRSELLELKARVATLEEKIAELENEI